MNKKVPKKFRAGKIVDERVPGTGFLGCCLNCSQTIGNPHLKGCEFVTGEEDMGRHGGLLGASMAQRRLRAPNE